MQCTGWRGRFLWRSLGLAALVTGLLAVPAHASFDCGTVLVRCIVQIDDSGRAWFESHEKLTEDALGDGSLKHGVFQIYQRVGEKTLLISKLPDGTPIPPENKQNISALLRGVSADGERVYISTTGSLVPEDGDAGHEGGSTDEYLLSGGTYTLLSTGPLDGPFPNPSPFIGSHRLWASEDGQRVYFETGQRLVTADLDDASDIYERSNGQTRLVSTGPDQALPTPEFPNLLPPETQFFGASPDGATVYFGTAEHLTADDTEKFTSDIFSWRDGAIKRITDTPAIAPGVSYEVFDSHSFGGIGPDGSIYFTAYSPQTPDDTNAYTDVYAARPDGSLERLTATVPDASLENPTQTILHLEAVSSDGARFFIRTSRALVSEDRDQAPDIYMLAAGRYELVSPDGPSAHGEDELMLCAISASGRRAYMQTWEQLSPQDSDDKPDVYEWRDGTVRLVSPASDGRQSYAFCKGISPNGRYVAFETSEELLPGDTDTKNDIYIVDMAASGPGKASAARARPAARKHRRRGLRLVTAEAIAPRMGIAREGILVDGGARLRLSCPKAERSGPCHGRVRLVHPRTHRALAAGTFRIPAGRAAKVTLKGAGLPDRALRLLARVRGADLLGNRRTVSATVELRRAPRP